METQRDKKKVDPKYIHSELSYRIIGILFDVYNSLGYGYAEKVYQRAVASTLKKNNLKFVEQLYAPVYYGDERIGVNYFDFLIEDKVVLEIKKGDYFVKAHIDQVNQYLMSKNLQLGILAYFAPRTVHIKRVVNLH